MRFWRLAPLLLAPLPAALLLVALPAPAFAAITWPQAVYNPEPYTDDLILPLPCGGAMAFRPVGVPAGGAIGDIAVPLGNSGSLPEDYNDGAHGAFLAAPFAAANGAAVYWMAKYTVTQSQYAALTGQCPAAGALSALPRTSVSWFDAVAFTGAYTSWLLKTAPTALPARGGTAGYIRLPTEVEWEFAARGGVDVTAPIYFADAWVAPEQLPQYAVAGEDFSTGAAAAIGSRKPNPLGLYDMLGNAGQWTLDLYHFTRLGRLSGLTGGFVVRGGSYATPYNLLSSALRQEVLPFDPATGTATKLSNVGFRVVIGIATGDDDARAAALHRALGALAGAQVDPARQPLQALPQLEADTADPVMAAGLEAVGGALKKAGANTLRNEIDAATSMTLAIYKIQKDTALLKLMFTSPEFADLRASDSYIAEMKNLARDQDVLERLADSYSALLQSIVAAAPRAQIDQAIATENGEMLAQADPRAAFVTVTQQFLDQMAQGAFVSDDQLLTQIQLVKSAH